MAPLKLEVPVFSPGSAQVALARAGRIELNRAGSYPKGGLTPELSDVQSLSAVPVPLRISKQFLDRMHFKAPATGVLYLSVLLGVPQLLRQAISTLIRPRGPPEDGPDFIYSSDEFEEMRHDIQKFKDSGYLRTERDDGFVFGVLKARDGAEGGLLVDVDRNSELVRLASPFKCVFHRAFDEVLGGGTGSEAEETVRSVKTCGFDGVLTSGGPGSAVDNLSVLTQVVHAAAPEDIEVIVGGGVRSSNAQVISENLPRLEGSRVWSHSSCLTKQSVDAVDADELHRLGDILS